MDSLVEYVALVDGKSRKVKILSVKHRNTALVELDGKVVKVAFPNPLPFDEQTSISVNGRQHKLKLSKKDELTAFNVEVDGKQFNLHLKAKRKEWYHKASHAPISPAFMESRDRSVVKKGGVVTSLMPGKIVLIKVEIGDKVKAGDPLCILEAMKMANEIVAPEDGTITQVRVELGSFVSKGDVLLIIE